jgi:prepilin-type N-terminal cleavage/methylation domain-containing protein
MAVSPMKIPPTINNRQRRGFSLIEIMVAVTLLAVITVGLLAMFYHTQRAFRLGAGQVDTLEAGRTTMQLLSHDLQEMYPSHIPEVLNFQTGPSGNAARLDMVLPGTGGLERTNLLQDISFLARRGDEWIGVTYRVAHINRGAGTLYRAVISTNPAVQDVRFAGRRPEWEVVSNLFNTIITGTPDAAKGNELVETDNRFHRVADGVVHLRVRGAYDEVGRVFAEPASGVYVFTNGVPAYIDVELAILDPKAVAQFQARPNDTAARDYVSGQAHRLHLFTQRIHIRAHRSQFDLFDLNRTF